MFEIIDDFEIIEGDLCGSPYVMISEDESDFDDCDPICSLPWGEELWDEDVL